MSVKKPQKSFDLEHKNIINMKLKETGNWFLWGSLQKKFMCCFYMTIPVIWSSLDHSKDN
jgi:hypothetical protein